MKKFVIIVTILLVVLVVGFFAFNNYIYNEKQGDGSEVTPPPVEVLTPNYTDSEFGYQLYIPEYLTAQNQSDGSTLFYPKEQPQGPGPANFIYVSVVTPDKYNSVGEVYNYSYSDFQKLNDLKNQGASVNLSENEGQREWFTYTLVNTEDVDGAKVKNFENIKPWEFPIGTTENRFIYETDKNIYILGYYTGGDSGAQIDPRVAYSVIKSFKTK